jgi:hypothetical protein
MLSPAQNSYATSTRYGMTPKVSTFDCCFRSQTCLRCTGKFHVPAIKHLNNICDPRSISEFAFKNLSHKRANCVSFLSSSRVSGFQIVLSLEPNLYFRTGSEIFAKE